MIWGNKGSVCEGPYQRQGCAAIFALVDKKGVGSVRVDDRDNDNDKLDSRVTPINRPLFFEPRSLKTASFIARVSDKLDFKKNHSSNAAQRLRPN